MSQTEFKYKSYFSANQSQQMADGEHRPDNENEIRDQTLS